jgi:nitrogen fixation/metabolism regulation signal transduction histidine kinase
MVDTRPPTEFLSAERYSAADVRRQARRLARDPLVRRVVDSSEAFISVLNSSRQIVFANRAMTDAFGYDSEMALGARPGELIGCSNAATCDCGCGTSRSCSMCGAALAISGAQRGQVREEECRIIRTNGEAVDLRVTTTPFEVDGEDYTLFTAIDIGDTKRRRALERIFFHDILNTATGVRGLSSLARTVDDQDREKVIELLESTSDHLIDEIRAQRELLAAENHELVVRPEIIDAGKLLAEVADVYRAHDVARQKSIVIDPSTEQVRFLADPTLLGRVLSNLVKNALEATEKGGRVRLGVRGHQVGVTRLMGGPPMELCLRS